jgi:adenylate cyclase
MISVISGADILSARILIVDDQAANVSLLERLLASTGYTAVTSTMDPQAVCDLHRANGYALILLDLQMPAMDGFEVLKRLNEGTTDDYVPVLVVTAQPGEKLRALQAGARDFISKPFDLSEVLTRVRNMLEVRLLHLHAQHCMARLEQTLREVENSREIIRCQSREVSALYDQIVIEQKLSEELQCTMLPDVIAVQPDDDIRALVPEFLANRGRDVRTLRTALARLDFAAVRRLGHTIKETGRGYGFDGLTAIGSAIERAAHHDDGAAVDTRITHLEQYLERVQVRT